MRYLADDGTIFEDEDLCYEYELMLLAKKTNVKFYIGRNRLRDLMNEELHYQVNKVIISSEKDIVDIERFNEVFGVYDNIKSIGIWKEQGYGFKKC